MKKREWLVGLALLVATLAACTGKENKQNATAPEIEEEGICPCCEAEVIYVGDSVAMVKDN